MLDDAVHIKNPERKKTNMTLCNKNIKGLHCIHIKQRWPDPWSGCWTCLAEAERITGKIPSK